MTNRIAFYLGASLIALVILVFFIFGSDPLVFLVKKLMDLIEWLAFWR
ncbi:MAG: hypothetical protein AAGF27_07460 [Pseudomonadota bacterium]